MSSTYLDDARRDGHDIGKHMEVLDFVDDGVTHFRIVYDTTQRNSAQGRSVRNIIIEREGAVHETDFGKADDTRPGWWAIQDGVDKFFVSERLIDIDIFPHGSEPGSNKRGLCVVVDTSGSTQ
jgi:hypothetical protein